MIKKTNKIKNITFKSNNNIFNEGAADLIKAKLVKLQEMKDELADKHMEVLKLEQEVLKYESTLNSLYPLIDIEYETVEVEDKVFDNCNLLINNPTDARYGYSN